MCLYVCIVERGQSIQLTNKVAPCQAYNKIDTINITIMTHSLLNLKAELINALNSGTNGILSERIKANNALFVYSQLKPIIKAAILQKVV